MALIHSAWKSSAFVQFSPCCLRCLCDRLYVTYLHWFEPDWPAAIMFAEVIWFIQAFGFEEQRLLQETAEQLTMKIREKLLPDSDKKIDKKTEVMVPNLYWEGLNFHQPHMNDALMLLTLQSQVNVFIMPHKT